MKTLYRPVGLTEMNLILDSGLRAFPPRLPDQPIFYPVLNKPYADQIASDWNTKDRFSGFVGFVTEFSVRSPFIDQYEEQIVGATKHQELWLPAEDLEEMNAQIEGPIHVIDAHYGKHYVGLAPELPCFEGKSLIEQLRVWHDIYEYNAMDFYQEVRAHWKSILMNYKYWTGLDAAATGISEDAKIELLSKMKEYWSEHYAEFSFIG